MNIIDRYIVRSFLMTLIFAILSLCAIFLIVNLLETLGTILDKKVSLTIIGQYYLYFLPEVIKILTPVAVLISCLFSIGRMSNLHEITAMKCGGMSLYRLMLPLVVVGIGLSFGQLYFNGWVVPKIQTKKIEIERTYLGKSGSSGALQVYNLYFRDTPTRNVILGFYDTITMTGNDCIIEEYTNELHPRITRRIDCRGIAWDSVAQQWILTNGIERVSPHILNTNDATQSEQHISTDVQTRNISREPIQLTIRGTDIVDLQRSPDEMNFDEQLAYIKLLEIGGKDTRMKKIEYYSAYAFPFANIIVMLFGVPFASVKKKNGIAVEIAAAMIISFSYLVFSKLSQSLGKELLFEPLYIGWSANAVFFLAGIFNLWRTRT